MELVNIAENRPAQKDFLKVFLNAIIEKAWVNPTPEIVAYIIEKLLEFEVKSCKTLVNNNTRIINRTRKNL
jgi:hypothetical protein